MCLLRAAHHHLLRTRSFRVGAGHAEIALFAAPRSLNEPVLYQFSSGLLIGTLYGVLDGAVMGAAFAWLYNPCVAKFGSR